MSATVQLRPRPRASSCSIPTDLSDIVSTPRKLPSRIAIHAPEKWGKTSFAAQAPKPIFQCTRGEDGLNTLMNNGLLSQIPHFPTPAEDWQEIRMNVQRLIINEHSYQTFVLDTANGAERLDQEHVCRTEYDNDWGEKGFGGYSRGFKLTTKEWIEFIQLLEELRRKKQMAIILLFHTQVVKFANPEGADYDRYQPAVNAAIWGETHKWCDMILFGAFETFVQMQSKSAPKGKGTGGQTRILHTERQPAFDAGKFFTTYSVPKLSLEPRPWKRGPGSHRHCNKERLNPMAQSKITYDQGTYRIQILSQEMTESKNGHPQLILTIKPVGEKLADGKYYECVVPMAGREPRVYLTFTDRTIDWVTATLRHIGFAATSFAKLDPSVEGYQSLAGIECEAACTHDASSGVNRENWSVLRGKTHGQKPVQPKVLRELDSPLKFGRVLAGTPVNWSALPSLEPSASRQPVGAGVRSSASNDSDEIPF